MPDPNARDESPEDCELITADDLVYESPPELDDEAGVAERRGVPPRSWAIRVAAGAGVVLVVAAVLLAYRAHHRRKVVASTLSRAEALMRLDTAAGYRKAAALLEPIARMDPIRGASARAFALAMLAMDHGDVRVDRDIDELLVAPGRADEVPVHAHLAAAAIALRAREAGTAMGALARAGSAPWAQTLAARVALLAGNAQAAVQPAAAAAEDGSPAGLAIHGDALRRLRADPAGGRAAYEAALAASPLHARAAYGLAKLSLAGGAPRDDAERALRRLVEDRDGTPATERARAALHLAALRLRAGDRGGAVAALGAVALDPAARAWADRAATIAAERRGPYRAVSGAPPALQSACDDDPGEVPPSPPPPTLEPRPVQAAAAKATSAKPVPKKRAAKAAAKAPAKSGASKKTAGATTAVKKKAAKTGATKRAPAKKATAKRATTRTAARQ